MPNLFFDTVEATYGLTNIKYPSQDEEKEQIHEGERYIYYGSIFSPQTMKITEIFLKANPVNQDPSSTHPKMNASLIKNDKEKRIVLNELALEYLKIRDHRNAIETMKGIMKTK